MKQDSIGVDVLIIIKCSKEKEMSEVPRPCSPETNTGDRNH